MDIIFWVVVFVFSLIVLVKGADFVINASENIGRALRLSPFVIGVLIVGIGTSLPELVSSIAGVIKGASEIVVSNAVGSNIANILLIVGISAVIAKRLDIKKNLIDVELPLLALGTVLFSIVALDAKITFGESIFLVCTYLIYLAYTLLNKEDEEDSEKQLEKNRDVSAKLNLKDFGVLVVGILGLVFGANYLIDSVVNLSQILNIAVSVISVTAIAVGTSLPELVVSVKAAMQKKAEIAVGNIFGSNAFNILMVVGLPGFLANSLVIDENSFNLGFPFMVIVTFLFIISGISKRIHVWEGFMFLNIYILFVAKLFNIV